MANTEDGPFQNMPQGNLGGVFGALAKGVGKKKKGKGAKAANDAAARPAVQGQDPVLQAAVSEFGKIQEHKRNMQGAKLNSKLGQQDLEHAVRTVGGLIPGGQAFSSFKHGSTSIAAYAPKEEKEAVVKEAGAPKSGKVNAPTPTGKTVGGSDQFSNKAASSPAPVGGDDEIHGVAF